MSQIPYRTNTTAGQPRWSLVFLQESIFLYSLVCCCVQWHKNAFVYLEFSLFITLHSSVRRLISCMLCHHGGRLSASTMWSSSYYWRALPGTTPFLLCLRRSNHREHAVYASECYCDIYLLLPGTISLGRMESEASYTWPWHDHTVQLRLLCIWTVFSCSDVFFVDLHPAKATVSTTLIWLCNSQKYRWDVNIAIVKFSHNPNTDWCL